MNSNTNYCLYVHITPNSKLYIGVTNNTAKRWKSNGVGYKGQRLFWRAIEKYGWSNLKHIVLLENISKDVACACEQYLIDKYQTNNPQKGYNVAIGGEINKGYHHSIEQRQRQSALLKGRFVGELNGFYGKHHTEETKLKCGASMKGKHHTEEARRRISEAQKMILHTEERNKKISEALQGYKHTEAFKQACSERMMGHIPWNKGKPLSESHKQKLKENHVGMKGRKHSEETKQKMREAYQRRREKANACIEQSNDS